MAGPYDLDYSPAFQPTPQTGVSRGLTHLGSVLDAIMERKSREQAEKARLAQAAAIAAEDDKRQRDQLNWTMKHQGAEEDIARERLTQDEQDKVANRALTAMPHFDAASAEGDIEGMKRWGAPGGIEVKERPQTPAMDLLGALTDKPAPADPLGAPPPMGYTPMGEIQAPPGVVPPPEPPASPSLLDAQLAAPKPPKYDITVPGGPATEYDPTAVRTRRMERGGQAATDIAGTQSPSPFHRQALAEVQTRLRTGKLKPEDADAAYEKRVLDLEHEANKTVNARIGASARTMGQDKVHPAGELDFLDPYTHKVIGQTRSPEEGRKFREGHDALVGIRGEIGKLKEHVLTHGRTDVGGIPIEDSGTVGEREALISNVTDYLTTLKNTGVLNGGEYDRYVKLLGTSIMRGGKGAAAVLDQILAGAHAHYMSHSGSARASSPSEAPHPKAAALSDEADQLLEGQ